jgi:hypothetical protein
MRVRFKNDSDRINFLKSQYKGRVSDQKIFFGIEFTEVGVSFVKVHLDRHHSKYEFFNRDKLIDVDEELLKIAKNSFISNYLS